MNLTLNVWRQPSGDSPGRMERYVASDVSPDTNATPSAVKAPAS